jgi:hypothetical protein
MEIIYHLKLGFLLLSAKFGKTAAAAMTSLWNTRLLFLAI